jgi:hypothetical protein
MLRFFKTIARSSGGTPVLGRLVLTGICAASCGPAPSARTVSTRTPDAGAAGSAKPDAPVASAQPSEALFLPAGQWEVQCRRGDAAPARTQPGRGAPRPNEATLGRPRRLWQRTFFGADDGGVAVRNGIVYTLNADEQALLALDASTGEIVWRAPLVVSHSRSCGGGQCDQVFVSGDVVIAKTEDRWLT